MIAISITRVSSDMVLLIGFLLVVLVPFRVITPHKLAWTPIHVALAVELLHAIF
jgi:hypothetical protein